MNNWVKLTAVCALGLCGSGADAQQAMNNGIMEDVKLRGGTGVMGQIAEGDFQIGHKDGFKGAQRVAISVFNVAFPDEYRFSANLHKKAGGWVFGAKSTMHTTMTGLEQAAEQRIADAAYANFVADLKAAGFDVVGPDELAKLTPEYASWTAQPNFSRGRFGTYVAPTGRQIYFLRGDGGKRDSSGNMGQLGLAFRAAERPQAFMRSAYIARDGNIGIIAVTMVIDYGVYSTSGESKKVSAGASTGFSPGVSVQGGSLYDPATMLEYWRPTSGGFPADAVLAVPIRSLDAVGEMAPGTGDVDYTLKVDSGRFEKAALAVAAQADTKLVATIAAAR